MPESERHMIRKAEVASVADKLSGFMVTLPAQEKEVLQWVLERAKNAPDIVDTSDNELVSAGEPFSEQLGRAVGLNEAAGTEVGVTWKHAFGAEDMNLRGRFDGPQL